MEFAVVTAQLKFGLALTSDLQSILHEYCQYGSAA
jgi:hypothetical protein